MPAGRFPLVVMVFLAFGGARLLAQHAAVLVERENRVEAQVWRGAWKAADVGLALAVRDKLRTLEFSRAAVQFTDSSVLRVREMTTVEITPPTPKKSKGVIELKQGGVFFFSREKELELEIRTPAVNGALRGTELVATVSSTKTTVRMLDGEIELSNPQGSLVLRSGEQGEAEVGQAPRRTAVIEAANIIQWCLYYPGVLDPAELGLSANEQRVLADALGAYGSGDLLGALVEHPLKHGGGSVAARVFRAAVTLSVGEVEKARAALAGVPIEHPGRRALEQMIAAVKFQQWTRAAEPRTSSEWMAESYYRQSRSDLKGALEAARKATELSPNFGFAWARVAELEFSFGRTPRAMKLVERAIELAPRNAQAHALQGFLLSAQNRIGAARRSFEEAIALDGALGNAWLGRGLTFIRQGEEERGQRDLQIAAALEPNRSLIRSYLGKAFSQVGEAKTANLELDRAKALDANDPTPWLYSAIQRRQENRYNAAIDDLEKSIELNENRRVYRSQFLLDQDRAIRGTNLASIYQDNGMTEQGIREAVRAVNADYASASAHLFLANSYNALRDPTRVLLRYETAWFNELLLSNLLSPVGGGPLSQFVSEQEYSKLFERDGLGISSLTEYYTDGKLRETASQYGTAGNVSYALDAEYYYDNGIRPNSRVSRFEGYATFKLQLGPQDTIFLQTKYQDTETGDVFQRYDQGDVGREVTGLQFGPTGEIEEVVVKNVPALTYDFREKQEPGLILGGWRHEWSPGNQTVLLLSRLANDQTLTIEDVPQLYVARNLSLLLPTDFLIGVGDGSIPRNSDFYSVLRTFLGRAPISELSSRLFDMDYRASFETYGGELQQMITLGPDTIIAGARFQHGQFNTGVRLFDYENGMRPDDLSLFEEPEIRQDTSVDFGRISLYLYNLWHATPWLTLAAGVTYDKLDYPENFRNPPLSDQEVSADKVSPKVGVILRPWSGAVVRGAYMEAISGTSFDESVRLEPMQVAGFLQAYRTIISESIAGGVAGAEYKLSGASFEQKLPTRTYLGVEYNILQQDVDRTIGSVDSFRAFGDPLGDLPSDLDAKEHYREDAISASLNQLLGNCWSVGASYRYTHAKLRQQLTGLTDSLATQLKNDFVVRFNGATLLDLARFSDRVFESDFHQLSLFANFNHPSGFFARAEANWYRQENDEFSITPVLPVPGDVDEPRPRLRTQNLGLAQEDFWQLNLFAGYRFHRNQCELSVGFLNMTGEDYRLHPLTPYAEFPRDQTLVVRCKLTF